jgi:DNA polymerase-1
MSKKRIVIVDALNVYIRSYIVNPSISENGNPVGGIRGFLGFMQSFCQEIKPDRIVIVWDGEGGSRKKRQLNKNYKQGRKPISLRNLNRSAQILTEEQEQENRAYQQKRLMAYLYEMPVSQIRLEGVEADDIIAHVCNVMHGWEKVIISSDKDFIQLCNDETVLYRPVQKEVLNKKRVIEKYGIAPDNFALARAMAGDVSDNLPGIPRVGLKTIANRFPFFREHRGVCFDLLYQACKDSDSKAKIFSNVLEHKDKIELNYKIMQLYSPDLEHREKYIIKENLTSNILRLNRTEIYKMMGNDGFFGDLEILFSYFRRIINSGVTV